MEEAKTSLCAEISAVSPALPAAHKVEQLVLNICDAFEGFFSGSGATPHMNVEPSNILLVETDSAASKAVYKLCDP